MQGAFMIHARPGPERGTTVPVYRLPRTRRSHINHRLLQGLQPCTRSEMGSAPNQKKSTLGDY